VVVVLEPVDSLLELHYQYLQLLTQLQLALAALVEHLHHQELKVVIPHSLVLLQPAVDLVQVELLQQ
jgi:hypothetical protein